MALKTIHVWDRCGKECPFASLEIGGVLYLDLCPTCMRDGLQELIYRIIGGKIRDPIPDLKEWIAAALENRRERI